MTKQEIIVAVQRKLRLSDVARREGNIRVALALKEQANALARTVE